MIRDFDKFDEYSLIGQGAGAEEIEFLNHLNYQDEIYKKGGFANIHQVISVNGEKRNDLLLKLYHQIEHAEHAYIAIKQLHLKLKRKQLKSGISTFQRYPTFLGLPFLVFASEDSLTGDRLIGLLMYDLSKLGYQDYGDEELGNELVEGYEESILYSYQLAKTVDLLQKLEFIHSDFKSASIFINPKTKSLCLIDFDSGFNHKTQNKPSTKGSITGWFRDLNLLNSLSNLFSGENQPGFIKFQHNEVWALNAAIFQFFSGQSSPYSFLTTLDDTQIKKYIGKISWPNFSPNSKLFNENAEQSISDIQETLQTYEELLPGISLLFENSFNGGYLNYEQVSKPKEWINLLEGVIFELPTSPVIFSLEPDKSQIDYAGEKIKIHWEAQMVDYVSIGKDISHIGQSELEIPIHEEHEVEVQFHNFYTSSTYSIDIKANRRYPRIEFFKSDISVRQDESPVILSWSVKDAYKIKINGIKSLDPTSGKLEVKPLVPTLFKLQCEGGFGELSEAELFVDLIRPSVDMFAYEINLDYGLDNIDLKWKTSNAISVEITPDIGKVNQEGIEHIAIKDETIFTLVAKGLFYSDSKVIKAKPFPLPVIKELMVEFPKIDLNSKVNLIPLRVPDPMYRYNQIKFQNTVDSLPSEIKYFDGRIEFNLTTPDLGCNDLEVKEIKYPQKLTFKNLLEKVAHYLKRQSNG